VDRDEPSKPRRKPLPRARRAFRVNPLHEHPRHCRRRGQPVVSHDEWRSPRGVGRERASGVETEPSEPEQRRRLRQSSRFRVNELLASVALPFPSMIAQAKRRNARTDVNDGSRPQSRARRGFSAIRRCPNPVSDGIIDYRSPEHQ